MSEPQQPSQTDWLTPTAAGIAGLVIAGLSLLSNGTWLLAVQAWLNRNGSSALSDTVILSGIAQAVLAAGALLLARRALAAPLGTARHLGGATIVVGLLGLGVAGLTILAGIAGAA
jgi:hypothetical protein